MTIVLSGLIALLGVAMIASALVREASPLSIGVVVGVSFVLLGAARVYLAIGPRDRL